MTGFELAPDRPGEEIAALLKKIAELEATAEERFRKLADASPLMVWTWDQNAQATFFNRAWLEFRGRSLAEEAGNGWTEGVHPDDRGVLLETYLKSFSGRTAFRKQFRLRRADGEYCWVGGLGLPYHDLQGNFAGFTGSAVDSNERQQKARQPDDESTRLVFSLTDRERQVLVLIADGKSTKEAAAYLGISYKTADSHRSRILEKLGVHETASMVRYAVRSGLVEP